MTAFLPVARACLPGRPQMKFLIANGQWRSLMIQPPGHDSIDRLQSRSHNPCQLRESAPSTAPFWQPYPCGDRYKQTTALRRGTRNGWQRKRKLDLVREAHGL